MTLPTKQEFEEAKLDLDDLEQIVNGDSAVVVSTRIGGNKPSVDKVLADKMATVQPSVDAAKNNVENRSAIAVAAIQSAVDQAAIDAGATISALGWVLAGDSSVGFTVNNSNEYAVFGSDKYRWAGSFPKVVTAGETLEGAGGVSSASWVLVSIDAASRIGSDHGVSVQDYMDHAGQHAMMPALSQFTKTRVARILFCGTSIEYNSGSSCRLFLDQLQSVLGKSGNKTIHAGVWGGHFEVPYLGWNKQRFSGFGLTRSVGNNTSQTVRMQNGFVKRIVLRYSTELDGGSFNLNVDGALHTVVSCAGGQSYGNEVVITWPEIGYHYIDIDPPAVGNVYIETIDFCVDSPGIHVMDATLGGSSVRNYTVTANASGVQSASIPVVGDTGLVSMFNNLSPHFKPDLLILPYTVNDAGAGLASVNADSIPSMQKIVTWARNNNTHVLMICEMGGHYTLKTDGNHSAFNAMRKAIIGFQYESHVTLIDWHKASGLADADNAMLSILAARYYSATDVDVDAGTFNGDFIHPNNSGNAVLGDQLSRAAGLPPTGLQGMQRASIELDDDLSVVSGELLPDVDSVGGILKRRIITNSLGMEAEYKQLGFSRDVFSNLTESLWNSNAEYNYDTFFNDDISNAGTADNFGKFKDYIGVQGVYLNLPSENTLGKSRFTVTLIAAPGRFMFRVNDYANAIAISPSAAGNAYPVAASLAGYSVLNATNEPRVYHMTFEGIAGRSYFQLQGKFYGVYVTPTEFPCMPQKLISESRYVGPPVKYSDVDYRSAIKGRIYYEEINGKDVEKLCLKEPVVSFGLDGAKLGTLYRLLDKADCYREYLKLQGTITEEAFDSKLGSYPVVTSSNPKRYSSVIRFGANDAGREFCISGQHTVKEPTYRIFLHTGSTNTYLALQGDGSWLDVGGSYTTGPAVLDNVDTLNGVPFSLSFALPSGDMFDGRTNWALHVQAEIGSQNTLRNFTLCEGRAPTV